jgi:hypothetical protein
MSFYKIAVARFEIMIFGMVGDELDGDYGCSYIFVQSDGRSAKLPSDLGLLK